MSVEVIMPAPEFVPLNEQERELLKEFVKGLAPALVPFTMMQKAGIAGDTVQLNVAQMSHLAFTAAGFMVMEYRARCDGHKPTAGLNASLGQQA